MASDNIPDPNEFIEGSYYGIFQGDIIIRTAIIAAINDIRANPELLNYIFTSLPRDTLTASTYGEKEVQQARDWFLNTDIPVLSSPARLDQVKFPCITVTLQSSSEAEATTADIHYQPSETGSSSWPALTSVFEPVSYDPNTGIMVLPSEISVGLDIYPGMLVVSADNKSYQITHVLDDVTIQIPTGIGNFSQVTIKSAQPDQSITLESMLFREAYQIGCHVNGEGVYLIYLHSILTFILLRYKQALLEARGFERSQISSGDIREDNELFGNEVVYSRFITLTGFIRQSWPKLFTDSFNGINLQLKVIDGGNTPETSADQQLWVGDKD